MGNAKCKIQNAKFRGAKRRIIIENCKWRIDGKCEVRNAKCEMKECYALIIQVANCKWQVASFGTALIVQMANCKWQVASFGTLRVDCRLS